MISLVGYTGFVGSNIYTSGNIDKVYNSKNIREAYGTKPEILIYAGLRAEKYLANNFPDKDFELILQAEENIKKISPKRLVLISTIDVFKNPNEKYEDSQIEIEGLQAYGLNRYKLEKWVSDNYMDSLIIRLPGLYGINIKKNFIYDMKNIIPFMLKEDKFMELSSTNSDLIKYYNKQDNGFYKLSNISESQKLLLRNIFINIGFTAMNFTDSRNMYQFYPLSRLRNDIDIAIKNNIKVLNVATEPVSSGELYSYITGKEFKNEFLSTPISYNYKTRYANIFGGKDGYFMNKIQILEDIKKFMEV